MSQDDHGTTVSVTETEIDRAVAAFYDVAETMDHAGELRAALPRLRARTTRAARVRGRLGTRLCLQYRKDTGATGAIDWQKFREWLKEHMAEIDFARLLVSILSILLLLI